MVLISQLLSYVSKTSLTLSQFLVLLIQVILQTIVNLIIDYDDCFL